MAKKILSDGQYETVTTNTTLTAVPGKVYYIKNVSAGDVIITYGSNTFTLEADDLGIFVYDGTLWSNLTPSVSFAEANPVFDSVTLNEITTTSSTIDLLKGSKVISSDAISLELNRSINDSFVNLRFSNANNSNLATITGIPGASVSGLGITADAVAIGSTTLNATDLFQVDSGGLSSASISKLQLKSDSNNAYIGYYNYTGSNYNIRLNSNGQTLLNALSGQSVFIQNNNATVAQFSGSAMTMHVRDLQRDVNDSRMIVSGGSAPSGTAGAYIVTEGIDFGGTGLGGSMSLLPVDGQNIELMRSTSSGRVHIGMPDNGINKLQVNGSTANTTGVWATLSDERLKDNIKPVSNALDKVLFLADKTKQFTFKDGVAGHELGLRTGIVIDDEVYARFTGHISEVEPNNEAEGEILGWEYDDEDYIDIETETYTETELETYNETELDEDGNEVEVEKIREIEVEKIREIEVPKTRRIVTKEGEKARQLENSFFQYYAPAIKELHNIIMDLKEEIKELKGE